MKKTPNYSVRKKSQDTNDWKKVLLSSDTLARLMYAVYKKNKPSKTKRNKV